MRCHLFAGISLFCIIAMAPQISRAAGNVLLPSTSNNETSPLPDLGLGGTVATPADSKPALTPPAPDPAQASSITNTVGAAQTPTPIQLPQLPVNVVSRLDAKTVAGLPPGVMPTTVIHQPDMSNILAQAGKNLPYSLTLSISGQSIFGANDVQKITGKLGISREKIPSSCILTLRGVMQTDKGGYSLDGGASPQVTIHYDGSIKNYLMMAQALCASGKDLPTGSGLLIEIGGRYSIPLQQITCPVPSRQVTKLMITYDGSDKSQCVYE